MTTDEAGVDCRHRSLAPYRRQLIHQAIANLAAGLEAIEEDSKIRQQLTGAGYEDTMETFAVHFDVEALRRLLERARGVEGAL